MAGWVKNLYTKEANDSSSDDELPQVVSSSEMKSMHEEEINSVRDYRRRLLEVRKERKKLTMEKFLSEKKVKKTSVMCLQETDIKEKVSTDCSIVEADIQCEPLGSKPRKKYLKSYPKLNIKVQPLERISSSRAKKAINFKMNRLAKVSREDVSKCISYNEKLQVKNR